MKLTDESGQVVACYTYGTYGELLSGDTTFTPFLYNGRCGVTTDDNGLYYMRQRYYNPEIKRFVNQDILAGSLSSSQSLNRYSYVQGNPVSYTDPFGLAPENEMSVGSMIAHGVLGIVGMVPGWVGVVANLADAAIYAFVDHDYGMMAVSLVNAFSMGAAKFLTGTGRVVTQATRWGIFGRTITDATSKTAKYAYVFSEIVSNGMTFGMAVNDTMELGFYMYEKYEIHGRSYNSDTIYEGAAMIMNIFTMGMSGAETVFQCKALAGLIEAENIGGRLKTAFLNQTSSQRNQRLDGGSEGDTGVKKPYATSRPSYGKGQVEQVWEKAKDPLTGKVYDPSGVEIIWDPTKPRNGQWDMGHIPGEKYSEMHQLYMEDVISKEEFLEWYRNTDNYRPELPSTNRSHKYE